MKIRKLVSNFVVIVSAVFVVKAYALAVYKTVDENGSVVLSDQPIHGAEKQEVLHMADLQDSPSLAAIPAKVPETDKKDIATNTNAAVINPAPAFTLQEKSNEFRDVVPPPTRATTHTHTIKKLMDMRTQLLRLQNFYQKVQDDYQRSPSVNAQDENYRRTLITVVEKHLQSLEQNIVSLEGSLGPIPHATLAMTDDILTNNQTSQLPLSSTQIAKLSSLFPENS